MEHIQALNTNQIQAFTVDQMAVFETTDLAAFSMEQSAALTAPQLNALNTEQSAALTAVSPIVLDLNGDGVHTLAASRGVHFDLMGTGIEHHVGWVAPTDGLLVMDRNGDGKINDGKELFGTATMVDGHRAGDGYAAMRGEDSNHDGKLTAADAHFNELKVWVDANSDGITQSGELHSLASLGIIELDLHAQHGSTRDNGNLLGLVSDYKTSDGHTHAMADVWFAQQRDHIDPASTTGGAGHTPSPEMAPQHGLPAQGVSASDLLSHRADDLVAGGTPLADVSAMPAVLPGELHLAQVDHTQLTDDPNKHTPLI
ncbi:MAG: hypothetical protein HYX44_06090 [Aquabacterium sp.]|nr:hypothetical protein [Aquabacterium sp.]